MTHEREFQVQIKKQIQDVSYHWPSWAYVFINGFKFELKSSDLSNYEFCYGSACAVDSNPDDFIWLSYLRQSIQFQLCDMHLAGLERKIIVVEWTRITCVVLFFELVSVYTKTCFKHTR